MPRHKDSFSIAQLIRNEIPVLIPPIEHVMWSNWKAGDDTPDGLHIVKISFFCVGMGLMGADSVVNIEEVDFIRDILDLFPGTEKNENLSSNLYLDGYVENYKKKQRII